MCQQGVRPRRPLISMIDGLKIFKSSLSLLPGPLWPPGSCLMFLHITILLTHLKPFPEFFSPLFAVVLLIDLGFLFHFKPIFFGRPEGIPDTNKVYDADIRK